MTKNILSAFLLICLLAFFALAATEDLSREIPVVFKGRFRPLESYARLWLYDFYHRESIKESDFQLFHKANGSASDFLWNLHFHGHKQWDDAPLFWIHYAELKTQLELDLKQDRFSFNQLQNAMMHDKKINLAVMSRIIPYFFFKQYRDPVNRTGSATLELTPLAAGLWVTLKDHHLEIVTAPKESPWTHLAPGYAIADNFQTLAYPKENQDKIIAEAFLTLLGQMRQYSLLQPYQGNIELPQSVEQLRKAGLTPKEMALTLESQAPLMQRLANAGTTLKALPGKRNGEWFSLAALEVAVFDPNSQTLLPAKNFTLYSDGLFEAIRSSYLELKQAYLSADSKKDSKSIEELRNRLAKQLLDGYATLGGKSYQKAQEKTLVYPSLMQLKMEEFYYRMPLIEVCIFLYLAVILLFSLAIGLNNKTLTYAAIILLILTFAIHTFVLILRAYILQRPPVSNMFETVIYVPWIAVLASLVLRFFLKSNLLLIASAIVSLALLAILKIANVNDSLENVQAVLDSQYWLIIHVLMIVGSYGVFALCCILGHLYLISYLLNRKETPLMAELGKAVLQSMYLGTALLIPGTILGGVWAAESWGRFWDWDPKESWAFISCCLYLIWIHAFTFQHIRYFGLSIGAVIGFQAISFTWYGVNYILGTGLHSYGFGSGGESYYYAFLIAEALFLGFLLTIRYEKFRKT